MLIQRITRFYIIVSVCMPAMICNAQTAVEALRAASVRIVSDAGIGTGYVIDDEGHVATNRHVLAGAGKAHLETLSGDSYPLTDIAGEDTLRDVLVLKVRQIAGAIPALNFRSTPPVPGEKVYLLGNEANTRFSPLAGEVIALDSNPVYGPFLKFRAPVVQGYSGGALVDGEGKVLATVVAFTDDDASGRIGYAIPNSHLSSIKRTSGIGFSDWSRSARSEDAGLLRKLLRSAQTALKEKRYARAISLYEQVFTLFPLETPVETYYNHALCCYSAGDFESARRGLEHFCREAPDDADGPFLLGLTHESLGNFPAAVAAFQTALRIKPEAPDYMYQLAIAHFKNGDRDQACDVYGGLLKKSHKHAENLRIQIGHCGAR